MYHSITYGSKNTWTDWHIVPASRPLFLPPTVKTHTLEIPGMDGVLDETEALTGYPVYNNRQGSTEFIVMNGYQQWYTLYSEIMNHLHGKKMQAILEDEPGYFYEGRFNVNEWRSEKDWSRIVIEYDVNPYKWSVNQSTDWAASRFSNRTVSGSTTTSISLIQSDFGTAPVCPTITVSSNTGNGVKLNYSDGHSAHTVILRDGTKELPGLVLTKDYAGRTLRFTCNVSSDTATVSVNFRKGLL